MTDARQHGFDACAGARDGTCTGDPGGGRLRRRARAPAIRAAGAVALAAATLGVLGAVSLVRCTRMEEDPRKPPPLIVVGVDGLEWELVLRFGKEGVLPNLMALSAEGFAARLETLDETYSPLVWTTVATGVRPEKHGITGFSYEGRDGEPHLFASVHRRTKALWNLFSERGLTTGVYGWWCTFPVEEIRGEMVAQASTLAQIEIGEGAQIWKGSYLEGLPKTVWPEELQPRIDARAKEIESTFGDRMVAAFGRPKQPFTKLTRALWGNVGVSFYADLLFREAALDLLREKRPYDALLVYFGVPDVASHMFWRHFEPEKFDFPPPKEEVEDFGRVIRDSYRFVDAAIGEIRRLAPEADLLVLSDHGFHAANVHVEFNPDAGRADSGHHMNAPPGVLIAAGRSFARRPLPPDATAGSIASIGRVEDVAPTLLARAGIAYGHDMDGRPMTALLGEDVLRAHPIESVRSHENAAWRAARAEALARFPEFERRFAPLLRRLDEQSMKRLRELGYPGPGIDEPPPSKQPPPSDEPRAPAPPSGGDPPPRGNG